MNMLNGQINNMNQFIYIFPQLSRILTSVLVGLIVIFFARNTLRIFFNGIGNRSRLSSYKKRLETLRTLMDNIMTLVIFALLIIIMLKDFGFDITPILASAGIAGLALSFGAQTLVRDFLSGFFILIENQFNVGDHVIIGTLSGKVDKINLRTTVLTDKKENTVIIPNSKIEQVVVLHLPSKKHED